VDSKGRTTTLSTFHTNFAAMTVDDAVNNMQAQASTLSYLFSGEKRIKYLAQELP